MKVILWGNEYQLAPVKFGLDGSVFKLTTECPVEGVKCYYFIAVDNHTGSLGIRTGVGSFLRNVPKKLLIGMVKEWMNR